MKKQISFFFLLFLISFVASAQTDQKKEITMEERIKMLVNYFAQKIVMTKHQKDSLTTVYTQFSDDIQKYRADNNAKLMAFLTNNRDEKVKNILHDNYKYDQYLLVLEEIKKKPEPQQGPSPQQQGPGLQNQMGNGRGL